MNSALLSSKDMNWCTPPEFLQLLAIVIALCAIARK